MNFIEELKWRGMLHDMIPGTDEFLEKNLGIAYIGYDPTAPSLTIGNLVTIMMLVHFQRHGHKPVVLLGGATGRIGDPSGRSTERSLMDEETLLRNIEAQRGQFGRFLQFGDGPTDATMVNNYDWISQFSLLDFLRDVGKHLTVNYMLSKDSVQNRMETGISFTEFSYQLIQGYDFYHLFKNEGVRLQMGGSDQWGNITSGTELIRRMTGGEGEAYAVTTPLLTKSDGTKFGKSAGGNVWLSPEMTSPFKFFQFWINSSDEDIERFLRIFSLRSKEEIEALMAEHMADPGRRLAQNALAEELTERVHGPEALAQALSATKILFGGGVLEDLKGLSPSDAQEVFSGVPSGEISSADLAAGMPIIDFLRTVGAVASNGEARRMILENKSLAINLEKCEAVERVVTADDAISGHFILINKSKKQKFVVYVK